MSIRGYGGVVAWWLFFEGGILILPGGNKKWRRQISRLRKDFEGLMKASVLSYLLASDSCVLIEDDALDDGLRHGFKAALQKSQRHQSLSFLSPWAWGRVE